MVQYDKSKKLELISKVGFKNYFKANSWNEYNKLFFDGLAKKYDAANMLHSFGTKNIYDRKAIANLDIPPNAKVLDLCTGSGDIAIHIAKTAPDSHVTGLDVSEEMMKYARVKAQGLTNVTFINGDALNIPFDEESFDVTIISFGLRNLTDLIKGLEEMKRVTKKGGIICNIDQGKPENPIIKLIYKIYFYNIAPILGKLVFHMGEFNSFRYLPESNNYFPAPKELMDIMRELGLRDIKNYNFLLGAIAEQTAIK